MMSDGTNGFGFGQLRQTITDTSMTAGPPPVGNLTDPATPGSVLETARQMDRPPAGSIMAVLTLGYDSLALYPDAAPTMSFPVDLRREHLDPLMVEVAIGIEQRGYCLALYPSWVAEPARQRLETVRRLLGTSRLVHRPVSLPPLAGAVLASLLTAIVPFVDRPGEVLASLPALERSFMTLAWMRSVARLGSPAPSVLQHAASWLPWTQFTVTTNPPAAVRRLRRKRAPNLPRLEGQGVQVAIAGKDPRGLARMTDLVDFTFEGAGRVPIPPSSLARVWWGTDRVIEAVPFPTEVSDAVAVVAAGWKLAPCRWCGEDVPSDPCPFCHMTASSVP
jgi:hypothetical protein